MTFDIISIIFIIIALVSIIVGFFRGFLKTIISLIKNFVSLIAAVLLARPLGTFLASGKIGSVISDKLVVSLSNKGGLFTEVVTNETKDAVFENCFRALKVPDLLNSSLSKLASDSIDVTSNITVAEALSNAITLYSLIVISFILIFIVVRLLAIILNKICGGLTTLPLTGILNKLLGAVAYCAIGIVLICLISYAFTFVIPLGGALSEWLVNTMYLNDDTKFTISKYFYNKNYIMYLINLIQGLNK